MNGVGNRNNDHSRQEDSALSCQTINLFLRALCASVVKKDQPCGY